MNVTQSTCLNNQSFFVFVTLTCPRVSVQSLWRNLQVDWHHQVRLTGPERRLHRSHHLWVWDLFLNKYLNPLTFYGAGAVNRWGRDAPTFLKWHVWGSAAGLVSVVVCLKKRKNNSTADSQVKDLSPIYENMWALRKTQVKTYRQRSISTRTRVPGYLCLWLYYCSSPAAQCSVFLLCFREVAPPPAAAAESSWKESVMSLDVFSSWTQKYQSVRQ